MGELEDYFERLNQERDNAVERSDDLNGDSSGNQCRRLRLPSYKDIVLNFVEERGLKDAPKKQVLEIFLSEHDVNHGKIVGGAAWFASSDSEAESYLISRIVGEVDGSVYMPRNSIKFITSPDLKHQLVSWLTEQKFGNDISFALGQCLNNVSRYDTEELIVETLIECDYWDQARIFIKGVKDSSLREKLRVFSYSPLALTKESEKNEKRQKMYKALEKVKQGQITMDIVQQIANGETPAEARAALRHINSREFQEPLVRTIFDARYRRDISPSAEARAALEYVGDLNLQKMLIDTILSRDSTNNRIEAGAALNDGYVLDRNMQERLKRVI